MKCCGIIIIMPCTLWLLECHMILLWDSKTILLEFFLCLCLICILVSSHEGSTLITCTGILCFTISKKQKFYIHKKTAITVESMPL